MTKVKKKYTSVNVSLIYELSWDWLAKRDDRQVIGTSDLSREIFAHLDIQNSAKFSYLNLLIDAKKFPKHDGEVGRAKYWYKSTLEKFKIQVTQELDNKAKNIKKTQEFSNEFERTRQAIIKKMNSYRSADGRINYFKADGLQSLLDALEKAPTEETENLILTELANLWRLCRQQPTALSLAG
ncbi:MAG: hypothetical protein V4568_18170 [Pseudomonadota bacterium]